MPLRKRSYTADLLTTQQGDIQKVGFLRKKGHIRRNWLDRWFVLTSEGLYYYKNRTDPKPIGVIPLFGSTVKEGKDYPIQASTRDEMLVWVTAIDDARNERNKRPPNSSGPTTLNPAAVSKSTEPEPQNGATAKSTRDSDDDSDED